MALVNFTRLLKGESPIGKDGAVYSRTHFQSTAALAASPDPLPVDHARPGRSGGSDRRGPACHALRPEKNRHPGPSAADGKDGACPASSLPAGDEGYRRY